MASISASQQKQMPKDALVIASILKELGVNEYEPRVINQLLEFTYRYVTTVLDDAKAYANHAKKKVIDIEDVRLAVQMQLDKSFTTPPSRDILLDVARNKNNSPLPLVKPHCGIRLPPDRYCLNNCNYRLKSTNQKKFHTTVSSGSYSSPQQTVKVSSAKTSQLQLVKRPAGATGMATVPRTQSLTAPKIKFSAGPQGLQAQHIVTSSKSNIHIPAPSFIKMETDEDNPLKRKREPDDFDPLDQ